LNSYQLPEGLAFSAFERCVLTLLKEHPWTNHLSRVSAFNTHSAAPF
jgi:hypothetical protein